MITGIYILTHQWLSGYGKHLSDLKCAVDDLEVMALNPSRVEIGVCSTSV